MKLKTILPAVFLLLAIFAAMPASAQLTFGARAGVNLSTQPTPDFNHEVLALPYAGLFGQYQLSAPFALQLGVSYSGEGVKLDDETDNITIKSTLDYLNVPLLAQYKFPFGAYLELGPQIGFLLSAKASATGIPSEDDKSDYKSTDFSGLFGLGYEVSQGAVKGLGINVRYSRSLTDINKAGDGATSNIYNRVLSIGLTYRLMK